MFWGYIFTIISSRSSIGYGDICPGDLTVYGKIFLVAFILSGLGVFCGPVMDVTSSWKRQIPGGFTAVATVVLGLGVTIFTSIEGVSHSDALYASIITGKVHQLWRFVVVYQFSLVLQRILRYLN